MSRVAIGGLYQEFHIFFSAPATLHEFESFTLLYGAKTFERFRLASESARNRLERCGMYTTKDSRHMVRSPNSFE